MITRHILVSLFVICLTACDNGNTPTTNPQGFQQYQGQWLVINYWASWCKPCIEEIPELNHFAQQAINTKVFAVNFDGIKGPELKQQTDKIGISFIVLEDDPASLLQHPVPTVLPTTYIYNPQGQLHKTLLGPQTITSLNAALQLTTPTAL